MVAHNAGTHTLVLIFPADTIREIDARRAGTSKSRVQVIAEAVKTSTKGGRNVR